ncbi:tRNA (N6-isopentenyl adenosine(37)-C2)-methylthiotransferase MiaB [Mesoterricola sediminis]|uniref:tRNA-2-methylthio-N(6)-dimethylallyladenosine synthase n=1 Tax=Mesoterricola sediminis TaxID=2927980 RepID=A0AA48H406_9BACT|nr:tRNA (N6-isopentenyl adenosine(37)-C2)-methylthiotransferase MiaB [Mesoterricola sediminis]BDU77056.1 tRNA-2-methylthio-N(6)-dimethylallyladenosine synthase [Mesoterricola sediminis]
MKYLIETWGCQMNDHDSEKLAGLLAKEGFEAAAGVGDADVVILNTCSIREKAVNKVYSELGRLREEKLRRPLLVGVTGCLAQQEKEGLFRRAPQIDFVMGTMAIQQLPRLVEEARAGRTRVIDTGEYPDNHLFPPETALRHSTAKALVTIIEGCNHACTYCVVPTTRGPERHRPWKDVVAEVRDLVEMGYREVELLGQNVNSYMGGCTFAQLLDRVAEVDGLEWIRFTTSHPMNFTRELARTLVTNPKVAPFLHLPVQSGSDAVLRRMRREYTIDQYLERLGYLEAGRDRLCLSTDFIVGFPGETEADFEATMALLERVRYDASFSFIYSPRPGTPALRLQDDLPAQEKSDRLARLQARQVELTLASNRRMVGRTVPARVESRGAVEGGHWLARTGEWKNVHLAAGEGRRLPFGELVNVRITDAGPHFLKAEIA